MSLNPKGEDVSDIFPHVAAVAGRHEAEKIRRIVDEVTGLINAPESRHTFLVIDGWHAIGTAGADFEDIAEGITKIAADGPSARVHVVVTTPRWTTMRPAIRARSVLPCATRCSQLEHYPTLQLSPTHYLSIHPPWTFRLSHPLW